MIDYRDITVVMQGDIRAETLSAVRSVREVLPGAYLVLSTFTSESVDRFVDLVDEVVAVPDPGALPPFTIAFDAVPNNLNRQLVSTQNGLKRVATLYALKMRTDCVLHGDMFIRLHAAIHENSVDAERLIVSGFYTRHPRGLSCYLFHISDWFIFGLTSRVKQFCSVPLMSVEDASWFERHPHAQSSTYAARRFRARYTPEQHIAVFFAKALGYQTPGFLNEVNELLVGEYERFLASEFVVARPDQLGFELQKYSGLRGSLYQRIDCVGFDDWYSLFSGDKNVFSRFALSKGRTYFMTEFARKIAHLFRHSIIRILLVNIWFPRKYLEFVTLIISAKLTSLKARALVQDETKRS